MAKYFKLADIKLKDVEIRPNPAWMDTEENRNVRIGLGSICISLEIDGVVYRCIASHRDAENLIGGLTETLKVKQAAMDKITIENISFDWVETATELK